MPNDPTQKLVSDGLSAEWRWRLEVVAWLVLPAMFVLGLRLNRMG